MTRGRLFLTILTIKGRLVAKRLSLGNKMRPLARIIFSVAAGMSISELTARDFTLIPNSRLSFSMSFFILNEITSDGLYKTPRVNYFLIRFWITESCFLMFIRSLTPRTFL